MKRRKRNKSYKDDEEITYEYIKELYLERVS